LDFEQDDLDHGTALSTRARLFVAKSANEVRTALNLDQEIDAHVLVFSGNSHYTIDFSRAVSADSATLVFDFWTVYGRLGIKNWKLTQYAQSLTSDPKSFERLCGSRLVYMIERAASVAAIVTIHNIDEHTKVQLNMNIGGGVDVDLFSGNAKLGLTGALDTASRNGDLEIQVVSTGGAGFGALSDSMKAMVGNKDASDTYKAITDALASYVAKFANDNAAPIGFHVGPFPDYQAQFGDLWSQQKREKLLDLVDTYRQVTADISDAKGIGDGDPRTDFLSPDQVSQTKIAVSKLLHYADLLALAHSNCLATSAGALQPCNLPPDRPFLPGFLYRIDRMPSSFALVVDGEVWRRARADEVLGDPGPGDLLTHVRIRKPTAQSAYLTVAFDSPYISDVTIFARKVGAGDESGTQHVFYPGRTIADQQASNRGFSELVSVMGAAESTIKGDLSLYLPVLQWVQKVGCSKGTINPETLPVTKGEVIARARNRFGFVREYRLATFSAGATGSWGWLPDLFPDAFVYFNPAWGEKPTQGFWHKTCTLETSRGDSPLGDSPLNALRVSPDLTSVLNAPLRDSSLPTGMLELVPPKPCVSAANVIPHGQTRVSDSRMERCEDGTWSAAQ